MALEVRSSADDNLTSGVLTSLHMHFASPSTTKKRNWSTHSQRLTVKR